MQTLLDVILPVFLVIGFGYVAVWRGAFPVSGIDGVMKRFSRVMTIENNWNDPPGDPLVNDSNRRHSHLAMLLRSRWLVDVDCWGKARGQPLKPGAIHDAALAKLVQARGEEQ